MSELWIFVENFLVSKQNNPLYIQSFTDADDALKLHHIVHCSLDVIDERGSTLSLTMVLLYMHDF